MDTGMAEEALPIERTALDDLKQLAKVGATKTSLATCVGLARELLAETGNFSLLSTGSRTEVLRMVLSRTADEAREKALSKLSDPSVPQAKDPVFQVAAAAELVGIDDKEAFTRKRQDKYGSEAVWDKEQKKKDHQGLRHRRQFYAGVWVDLSRTQIGRRENELLAAFEAELHAYVVVHRDELRDLVTRHLEATSPPVSRVSESLLAPTVGVAAREFPDAPWPFKVIGPENEHRVQWEDLLKGLVLTPYFCHNGGAVERKILHRGNELDVQEALNWLSSNQGRTIFLSGDRGDGKTSYINLLASRSADTHIFLRWVRPKLGFDVDQLREYRERVIASLGGNASDVLPTVVVVYSTSLYGKSEEESILIPALERRQDDRDDGVVVLVDGRPGDISRLMGEVGFERIDLAPIDNEEAKEWSGLLARACDTLKMGDEEVTELYPNLRNFLQLDMGQQIELLADPEHSLLVRLLRAVYGKDMWSKLYRELVDLPPADCKAYMHVCLASLAGMSLPDSVLIDLAPGVALDERSQRDPWIRNDEDENSARHQYIAQVVLEKSCGKSGDSSTPNRRALLAECVRDYGIHFRSAREVGDVLRQTILAIDVLEPVSPVTDDANRLRDVFRQEARKALLRVKDLYGAIHSQAPESYWHHAEWARAIWSLVQNVQAHDLSPNHLALLDACDKLLKAARDLPDCVDRQRIDYYLVRHRVLRLRSEKPLNFDGLCDAIKEASALSGSGWFKKNYYLDLFSWSRELLSSVGANPVEEPGVENVRSLYEIMIDLHETLRAKFPEIGSKELGGTKKDTSFGDLITRIAFEQFPREVATSILKEAWERSVELGKPNEQTGTAYAEGRLEEVEKARERDPSREEELRREAVEILVIIATSESPTPQGASLLARKAQEDEIPPGWADQLDEALKRKDLSHHARAHLNHARACIEKDKTKRIRFLQYAVSFYRQAAWPNGDRKRTVEKDWARAISDLEEAGFHDWRKHQGQFRRFYAGQRC